MLKNKRAVQFVLWVFPCAISGFGGCPNRRKCSSSSSHFQSDNAPKTTLHQHIVPVEDPNAALNTRSLAGVRYGDVLAGLDLLYPPSDLSQRNQISRTDGYWPFIKDGEEPPLELTYGEFDLPFFAELLDRANMFQGGAGWAGKTFCDIGSGTGRLVVAAAALHPNMRLSMGVEYLASCHEFAAGILESCVDPNSGLTALKIDSGQKLPLAPIGLLQGSIDNPNIHICDVDVAFVYSSAMPEDVMEMVGRAIGRQCKSGTIIITTDYELPHEGMVTHPSGQSINYKLELLQSLDGYCWVSGGTSTAFFYRLL